MLGLFFYIFLTFFFKNNIYNNTPSSSTSTAMIVRQAHLRSGDATTIVLGVPAADKGVAKKTAKKKVTGVGGGGVFGFNAVSTMYTVSSCSDATLATLVVRLRH